MNAHHALNLCVQEGVALWLEDGEIRLRAEAPPPADLLQELRTHRAGIIAFLEQCAADNAAEAAAMRGHYAARAGPDLPPDTYAAGLLRGFWSHRNLKN